jgi:hypothetical protein
MGEPDGALVEKVFMKIGNIGVVISGEERCAWNVSGEKIFQRRDRPGPIGDHLRVECVTIYDQVIDAFEEGPKFLVRLPPTRVVAVVKV